MEEMASLWSYQESIDELKQKILYTKLELETVKAKAKEEMGRNTESVKQLLQLLKLVCHERDEARDQIRKLLINIMPSMSTPYTMILDHFLTDQVHQYHQNPSVKPAKANSSIAESNSPSDAYNHSSPPVDSLFHPVTSHEFSKMNMDTPIIQAHCHEAMLTNVFHASGNMLEIDHATLLMESMGKVKALPQKGNLLQAVLEAGPLLQTLLRTNPLPTHRNPPPVQSFLTQKQVMGNYGFFVKSTAASMMMKQSQLYVEMSCGSSSQVMGGGGANILSFDDVNFGNCQGTMVAASTGARNFGLVEKRQRFQ